MRASELRHKTETELTELDKELSEQLFALRLQKVTGQLENPSKIGDVRRDLARVLTVLNENKRVSSYRDFDRGDVDGNHDGRVPE
jgi:large subunit ribosomal protein L29